MGSLGCGRTVVLLAALAGLLLGVCVYVMAARGQQLERHLLHRGVAAQAVVCARSSESSAVILAFYTDARGGVPTLAEAQRTAPVARPIRSYRLRLPRAYCERLATGQVVDIRYRSADRGPVLIVGAPSVYGWLAALAVGWTVAMGLIVRAVLRGGTKPAAPVPSAARQ